MGAGEKDVHGDSGGASRYGKVGRAAGGGRPHDGRYRRGEAGERGERGEGEHRGFGFRQSFRRLLQNHIPGPASQQLIMDRLDLFGSQIQLQGDLFGAAQWRIYQGVAKEFEFGSATSDSSP